jgi:hypothetical protein
MSADYFEPFQCVPVYVDAIPEIVRLGACYHVIWTQSQAMDGRIHRVAQARLIIPVDALNDILLKLGNAPMLKQSTDATQTVTLQ